MDDRVELEAQRIYESLGAVVRPWDDIEEVVREIWRAEARFQLAKGANDD